MKMQREQHNLSPITGHEINDPVLDHDHETGSVRAVLNRWENAVLGRLENWSRRIGKGVDPIEFLRKCADYIDFHKKHPADLKYPTFKTESEIRDLRNKKARQARANKRKESNVPTTSDVACT